MDLFLHLGSFTTLQKNDPNLNRTLIYEIAIYLTRIIKPSFYYTRVWRAAKFWQPRVFKQVETQKWNAFTLPFLSRRDLQILLVESCSKIQDCQILPPAKQG